MNDVWCNNCAKPGHTFNQCKIPITSFGCIVFRINRKNARREYLMICRRYSIAYLEFIRGKYNIVDKDNIKNLFQQMTNSEKELIKTADFFKIWTTTWGDKDDLSSYSTQQSCEKFNLFFKYELQTIIDDCLLEPVMIEDGDGGMNVLFPKEGWCVPEWGFPKGRREYKETDYNCAIREFYEETGIDIRLLHQIKNIVPIEENFMGSNYKTYKHKYYLMYMNYEDTLVDTDFQKTEVSCLSWKTVEECIDDIRPYNMEKKSLIKDIDDSLQYYPVV